jgi:hypothetical protein
MHTKRKKRKTNVCSDILVYSKSISVEFVPLPPPKPDEDVPSTD